MQQSRPLLILVGGFLGAGKTTLILCAADMVIRQGARVAVITNDQGDHLVDTRRVRAEGIDAAEIPGGCFCCRFSALMDAADQIQRYQPEFIFAEPVGSCTDLAATVMRPLQSLYPDRFRVAPLTVLVDPQIAQNALGDDGDSHLRFLFESQVREADVLCYTKADQYRHFPSIFDDEPLRISAATAEGVREWLTLVSNWQLPAGGNILSIDYERYAAAEASLGWLNAKVGMQLRVPSSPANVIGPLLERLDTSLSEVGVKVVHLKLFDETPSSYLKAAIVRNGQEPSVEGDLLAPAERRHDLLINLRAVGAPERLRSKVEEALRFLEGEIQVEINAFAPAYPKPEKRVSSARS